ncbi:MAG: ABC transporter ATP-binding protein, partial [Eubacteriales bacterium]|nr:ABC transporter ATP-binding protein [Eubacteriales bacterium]
LGIRPEFVEIREDAPLEGEVYGAMPTGMESTIKLRVGDYLLTGVVFGSSTYQIGSSARLAFSGNTIMLFDRISGRCITTGTLTL